MVPVLSLFLLLTAVAFFTLIERKVLGFIMLRQGPTTPSLLGVFLPFADALNLLSNPFLKPSHGSPFLLFFACILSFLVPSVLWVFVSRFSPIWDWAFTLLSILLWSSLSVYALLAAGWGSNSKYSMLGGTRCIAQCISYEVIFTLLFFSFSLFSSFNIFSLNTHWGALLYSHLIFILFVVVLAETNRSPFDFAEGESELVSGFNVEFAGPGFVLLFLSEYLSILFISFLNGALFCSCEPTSSSLLCFAFAFTFIWARGSLPRWRYDQLMGLCWKSLLPITLATLCLLLILFYLPSLLWKLSLLW